MASQSPKVTPATHAVAEAAPLTTKLPLVAVVLVHCVPQFASRLGPAARPTPEPGVPACVLTCSTAVR